MVDEVRLTAVGADERDAVVALALADDQRDLVASNAESLEEADEDPEARPRAILAGDRLVGFAMYEAPADGDEATIYRFMIDRAAQGRGHGRAALARLLDEIAGLAHVARIEICYMPDNHAARRLYAAAGFVEVGVDEDGEVIARLDLRRAGEGR